VAFQISGENIVSEQLDNIIINNPEMVAHTCNLSYAGGRDRRIAVRGWPALGRSARHYLKNNYSKKGW
jgi:hypothetical protein